MLRSRSSRRRRQGGFTLIELITVVAIVAIVAGLAAPVITSSISERRANEAALDLVRVARRARSEAIAYGRAHLLRIDAARGRIRVYRGINNGCTTNDWATITSGPDCNTPGSFCVDFMDLTSSRYSSGGARVVATIGGGIASGDICYRSNGSLEYRDGAGIFTGANTVGGGAQITFQRHTSDGPVGVVRRVVLPLGSSPRIMR